MGNDKGQQGPTVIGSQPGQIEIKKVDAAAEVKVPWAQIWRLMLCDCAIYLALTGCVILAREWILALAALGMGGLVCWRLWRRTENVLAVGIMASIASSIALLVAVPLARQLWGWLLAHPMGVLQVWGIGFLVFVVIYPMIVGMYRYSVEIVDPSGPVPPRTAIAWPGPVLPWQVSRIFKALNPPKGPDPEVKTERLQVEMVQREGNNVRAMDTITLLTGPDAIVRGRMVAKWILGGAQISERGLAGKGRPLSGREEYQAFIDEMLDRGLAAWRNPSEHRQGIELTAVGRRVLEVIVGKNGHGEPAPLRSEGA